MRRACLPAYHTAYNVIGVAVLLPLMGPFTRLIERFVPERGSPFTKYLDPASLRSPMVAVEAVRRTIERGARNPLRRDRERTRPRRPGRNGSPGPRRRDAGSGVGRLAGGERISLESPTRRLPRKATNGSRARCMRSIMQAGLPRRSTRWRKRALRPRGLRRRAPPLCAPGRCGTPPQPRRISLSPPARPAQPMTNWRRRSPGGARAVSRRRKRGARARRQGAGRLRGRPSQRHA